MYQFSPDIDYSKLPLSNATLADLQQQQGFAQAMDMEGEDLTPQADAAPTPSVEDIPAYEYSPAPLVRGMPSSPQEIDRLEQAGDIAPETAELMRARFREPATPAAAPRTAGAPGIPGMGEIAGARRKLAGVVAGDKKAAEAQLDTQQDILQQEQDAADAIATEEGRKQAAIATTTAVAQASVAKARAEEELTRQRISNRLEDTDRAISQAMSEYSKDPEPPGRWPSGGKGIGAAIAVALGAMGASLLGGPNVALKIIEDGIARDVDAWKTKKALQREKIGQLKDQRGGLRQDALDSQAQQDVYAMRRWQDVGHEIDRLTSQSASATAKANAEKAKAAALGRAEQIKAGILNRVKDNEMKVVMADADLATKQAMLGAQAAAAGAKREPGIEGLQGGERATKEDRKKAQESYSRFKATDRQLSDLIKLRQEYGSETLDRSAVEKMGQLASKLHISMKDQYGLGVLSESDLAMLNRIVDADPSRVGFVLDKLIAERDDMRKTTASNLKIYGGFRAPELVARGDAQ